MAFTIRPATRTDSRALIGLYGQSGAGKTYSALLLARGLVGPVGKIALIDTESGRGSLYSDVIPGGYDVVDLDAPFSPLRYMEAIEAAEKAGAECIVIDSMSHEWEGVGGVGDMAAQIETRTGKPGLHCWKEPKLAHQKMLLKLLQAKTHIICCLRAKRKSKQVKNERTGKSEIVKDEHYSPKQDGDFIFEMQVHAEILADHKLRVTKVSHPALANIFRDGVVISEATGRALAEWAKGGAIKAPAAPPRLTEAPPANDAPAEPSEAEKMNDFARELWRRIKVAGSRDAVDLIMDGPDERELIAWLLANDKVKHGKLIDHANSRRLALREAA